MTEVATIEGSSALHCCASVSFDITAVTKLKHADLWDAAKKMGGQSALARYLGLSAGEVGDWINMKRCPPAEPVGSKWTEDFLTEVEGKLLALTGLAWDELFPPALRQNVAFLDCDKTIEKRETVEAYALASYAAITSERITQQSQPRLDLQELGETRRQWVDDALQSLTYREREVIRLRFALDDGKSYTLEEVGRVFKVTRDRIRQIESKAIKKLQAMDCDIRQLCDA